MRVLPLLLPLALAACRGGEAPADARPAPDAPAATPATAAPPVPAPPPTGAPPTDAPTTTDTLTVVFFGDSLTEGYGLAGGKDEAYPALVAAKAAGEGVPLQVVNAGVSGNTSADGRARIGWALARATPDVFVLALGANDGLRGLAPEAMRANLAAILRAVREANPAARLVVFGIEAPPNYGADYTARFRAVFPSLAEEFDGVLAPFLLDRVAGVARLNQGDRVHPTAEGHRIMAETVWRTLAPVLRSPPAGA
jgi:acyl-CoA thioesterase-1